MIIDRNFEIYSTPLTEFIFAIKKRMPEGAQGSALDLFNLSPGMHYTILKQYHLNI